MTNTGNRCEQCAFWRKSDTACRRYPPSGLHGYPLLDAGEWCGEFKAAHVYVQTTAEPQGKKRRRR